MYIRLECSLDMSDASCGVARPHYRRAVYSRAVVWMNMSESVPCMFVFNAVFVELIAVEWTASSTQSCLKAAQNVSDAKTAFNETIA